MLGWIPTFSNSKFQKHLVEKLWRKEEGAYQLKLAQTKLVFTYLVNFFDNALSFNKSGGASNTATRNHTNSGKTEV